MKKVSSPTPFFQLGVRKKSYRLSLVACSCLFLIASLNHSAFSQNLTSSSPTEKGGISSGVRSSCSEQSLEILTTKLLRDLPGYANRATQRARRRSRSSEAYGYMLVAGRPEFQPLPLNFGENNTNGQKSDATGVEQVFFTTLQRQYINQKVVELQEFHWLFLTKTKNGWRLVMMFTQTGSYPAQQLQSPPRDSTDGTIAQGVKAWLRDCQAGSVRQ
ncbi:hypothetical protein I8748_00725 [Nostoc sp. CENA67]|uniref:Uncharacterized protein n=1 Tax=Amazonocrinis nigriterrae CENA67 TaxID=2794033 RepID=A0A8J7L786_9NOST|nr:hypothetical protein [Amazonocrinis nigriterrae]MBH8560746.1 hypothetical protein [Amazonocrinis nigriterrae CENA67]